jgi:hypothetical protein
MSDHLETTAVGGVTIIPKSPAEAAKALVYIGLTAAALISSASSGGFSGAELVSIIVAIVGLVPVYLLTGDVVKGVAGFVTAGLQAVGVLVVGGIEGFGVLTANDWVGVAITAFAAIGVIVVPNQPQAAKIARELVTAQGQNGEPVSITSVV